MHTNRRSMRFGALLSCRISKGAYSDCAFSAGKIQYFHSNYTWIPYITATARMIWIMAKRNTVWVLDQPHTLRT